jgi:GntR family transcriptional regulator
MTNEFVISQKDNRPMYLQIMDQVKQRVAISDWQPGDKVPSIRELAVSLKVSVITIKRAYLELEKEGVIVTQQGKGSYIADNEDWGEMLYQQELNEHLSKVIELVNLLGLSEEDILTRLQLALAQSKKEQT